MSVNYEARCETLKHIKRVNELLIKFAQEILTRAIEHDSSKLEEPEASLFESVTNELKAYKYNSVEYKEGLKKLGPALEHHYANNDHHPEFGKDGIKSMSLFSLVEMFLDWKSASERQNGGNINKSLEVNQERYNYSDELKSIFKNTVLLTNQW